MAGRAATESVAPRAGPAGRRGAKRWTRALLAAWLLAAASLVPAAPAVGGPATEGLARVAPALGQRPAAPLNQTGSDLEATARLYFEQGLEALRTGDFTTAFNSLDAAAKTYEVARNPAEAWRSLAYYALVHQRSGLPLDAAIHFERAVGLLRAAGPPHYLAWALAGEGTVRLETGQYAAAEERFGEALALARGSGDRPSEALALEGLGRLATQRGDYAAALSSLQQALAAWRAGDDRLGEGYTVAHLAGFYQRAGQPSRAADLYREALATARATDDTALAALCLEQLGNHHLRRGEYDAALQHFGALEQLWRLRDDSLARVLVMRPTAMVRLAQGDASAIPALEAAIQLERAAARTQGAVPFDRAREADLLTLLGVAVRRTVRPAAAAPTAAPAPAGRRAPAPRDPRLDQLADRRNDPRGAYAAAFNHFHEALAIWRGLGDRQGEAITLEQVGRTFELQGDLGQALETYRQAIAAREDVRAAARADVLKLGLADDAADLYAHTTDLLLRLGRPAEAFEMAERGRARTFLDQLGNGRLDLGRAAAPHLVERERALRAEIGALDRQLRQGRARGTDAGALDGQVAALQREYEDLVAQLRLADPEAATLVSVPTLTLPELQAQLGADTTLVSYYVQPERALAFVVGRDRFQILELPVGEAALRAAITEWRAGEERGRRELLEQLAGWLVAPLAAHLTTPVVGLVPHGPLHYLPFAALPHRSGTFGDAHRLFHLPSASTLPFIQAKRKGRLDSVLAVAQSRVPGLPPLLYADAEAQSIAALWGTAALTGPAGSRAAFIAAAGQHQVVHLAAHGELNEGSPLFSRVLLGADAGDDGVLTVQDVYALDLAQAELVVLSACQTQLGAQSRGDDLVGLNRAFLYAGAPTVVASLWSVDDDATSVLMTAYYRHLRAGMGKAAALQAAQAETRAQFPHPYYWAAFVLTGDPGP